MRFPFAATLDSAIPANGIAGGATLFGDMQLILKGLLLPGSRWNITGGLGIGVPTADDVRVFLDGAEVIRIENESVLLTPFLAALFTPNDRLFAQLWGQIAFDTNGNPVSISGGERIGRLQQATLLSLDAQLGYWAVRSSGWLRGVAPFLELHYTTTISDGDFVSAGPGLFIADSSGFDAFNMSAGLMAQIGNLHFLLGATVPLRNDDRFFDYLLGIRANWLFGWN
jgi:hypothetical protein